MKVIDIDSIECRWKLEPRSASALSPALASGGRKVIAQQTCAALPLVALPLPIRIARLFQLYARFLHNSFPKRGLVTHKLFGVADGQRHNGGDAARIGQEQAPFF